MAPTPPGGGWPLRSQYASRMSGPAQSFHPGASARRAKTSSGDAVDVASTKNAYSATVGSYSHRRWGEEEKRDERAVRRSLPSDGTTHAPARHVEDARRGGRRKRRCRRAKA